MTGIGDARDVAKRIFLVAAQEIDGGVGGDAGKPVRGFFEIFQLALALEGFNEGFLGEVLGVVGIADDAVDEQENAAQVLLDKAGLRVGIRIDGGLRGGTVGVTHATVQSGDGAAEYGRWHARLFPDSFPTRE